MAARAVLALLIMGLLGLATGAPATQQARPPDQRPAGADDDTRRDDQVTLGTDLVLLDVSVLDRAGRPIFNMTRERFSIHEDGIPQQIEFFSKEEGPVSLALVLDTSGSMRTKLETVVQAATNLVRSNKPEDEVAVVEFKDEAELLEEFTSDERDIEAALGGLVAVGQSALLDAILVSANYTQKAGRHRRKALVIVSDGVEKGSFYTLDQVVEPLRELDVRLYIIGFTDNLDTSKSLFKKSAKEKAEALINKLAGETGGRSFFPKDLSELGAIGEEIARDLRTTYAISYYPTNTKKDGTFRKVQVKIAPGDSKSDDQLIVRTRSGYYAGKQ